MKCFWCTAEPGRRKEYTGRTDKKKRPSSSSYQQLRPSGPSFLLEAGWTGWWVLLAGMAGRREKKMNHRGRDEACIYIYFPEIESFQN